MPEKTSDITVRQSGWIDMISIFVEDTDRDIDDPSRQVPAAPYDDVISGRFKLFCH